MLDSNLDDLVASDISSDRRVLATLADDIGFVGLCNTIAMSVVVLDTGHKIAARISGVGHTLPVHAKAILIAELGVSHKSNSRSCTICFT